MPEAEAECVYYLVEQDEFIIYKPSLAALLLQFEKSKYYMHLGEL